MLAESHFNPLEMIERVISDNDWPFDRTSDREIAVEVAGRWCDYRMFFSWRDDVEALHFTCAYDVRIPTERELFLFGEVASSPKRGAAAEVARQDFSSSYGYVME